MAPSSHVAGGGGASPADEEGLGELLAKGRRKNRAASRRRGPGRPRFPSSFARPLSPGVLDILEFACELSASGFPGEMHSSVSLVLAPPADA